MSIEHSTILITGGTGSFGNRVAAYFLHLNPAEIRIFSRDEKKQWEMRQRFPQFRYLVGDVRDLQRLTEAMSGADYVFHAAALKHVPSCEDYPLEAFKTNVQGSHNACLAARTNHVKAFVALSTDKAVKPVNAMGLSKAMMEKIVCSQNMHGCSTVFCCVRYGNVMGSRGSVIPLFISQIRQSAPLTLTVPSMTRFLMTLDESVDLVSHAMTTARGGEIFVRKAPACRVDALARAISAKYSPLNGSYPLTVTGMRPGEKMHEVLVNEYEMQRVRDEGDYFVIYPEYRVNEALTAKPAGAEYTSENTRQLTSTEEISCLLDAMGDQQGYI